MVVSFEHYQGKVDIDTEENKA